MEDNQPKGIAFFNIKSGETHYARLEAQIQAYINSSDMGINASRDQDFGWRLAADWVKAVKAFRRNETKMELLTSRNGGQKVTVPQILYAIYGEQLRAAQERADENDAPFEEEYLQDISGKPEAAPVVAPPVADPTDIPGEVDEADLEPAAEIDTDAGAEAATSDEPAPKTKAKPKKPAKQTQS